MGHTSSRRRFCARTMLGAAKCPEPLRTHRALPPASRCRASRRRALLRLPRYYALMRRSPSLPSTLASASFDGSLQVAVSPCWRWAPSRRYLCESFPACLDPYPGCSRGALARFFPQDIGLPAIMIGRRSASLRTLATSVRRHISRLQSFSNVQARGLARHPDRSYRSASSGAGQP